MKTQTHTCITEMAFGISGLFFLILPFHAQAQNDFKKVKVDAAPSSRVIITYTPSPKNPALDYLNDGVPRQYNQYVITNGVPTSITIDDTALAQQAKETAEWTLEGQSPPLLERAYNDLSESNKIKPIHLDVFTPGDVFRPGLLFALSHWLEAVPSSNAGWDFPSSNASFGQKTLHHKFLGKDVPAKVALFYPSTECQHPVGGPVGYEFRDVFGNIASGSGWEQNIPGLTKTEIPTPNWFYYYALEFTPPYGTAIQYNPWGSVYLDGAPVVNIGGDVAHGPSCETPVFALRPNPVSRIIQFSLP